MWIWRRQPCALLLTLAISVLLSLPGWHSRPGPLAQVWLIPPLLLQGG